MHKYRLRKKHKKLVLSFAQIMTDIDMIIGTGVVIERRDAFTRSMRDKPFAQQPSCHRGKTKVLQENKTFRCLGQGKEATQTLRKLGYTELCVLNSCQKRLTCNYS